MEHGSEMKALFIIVNAGFVDDVMEVARAAGAGGATIINARGESIRHESFMGITVDSAKEIVFTLVEEKTAEKIMAKIKEKAGVKSPAHSICFSMPIDRMVGVRKPEQLAQSEGVTR